MIETMLGTIWMVFTLPFRAIAWVVEMLGRATGVALGFALIVGGVALTAGPLYLLGIPLLLVGLLLALRSLG